MCDVLVTFTVTFRIFMMQYSSCSTQKPYISYIKTSVKYRKSKMNRVSNFQLRRLAVGEKAGTSMALTLFSVFCSIFGFLCLPD